MSSPACVRGGKSIRPASVPFSTKQQPSSEEEARVLDEMLDVSPSGKEYSAGEVAGSNDTPGQMLKPQLPSQLT